MSKDLRNIKTKENIEKLKNLIYTYLYNIKYKDKVYDSWVCIEDDHSEVPPINATITKLSDLKIKNKDTLVMEYDYGSTTTFYITFLGSKDLNILDNYKYPLIVDGKGQGMLDDLCDFELKEIVDDTDKLGHSDYYFTPGYERTNKYEYREYDMNHDKKEKIKSIYKIMMEAKL